MEALGQATTTFSLGLFKVVRQNMTEGGNIFFSPASIATALAMTYLGSKENTAKEMKTSLCLDNMTDEQIHSSFFDLQKILNTDESGGYSLRIANKVFARKEYAFVQEYLAALQKYYSAEASNLDFAGDSEGSRAVINQWVEQQTNNKIKDLLQPGSVNTLTAMVLVNAIYFKGDWDQKFDPKHTRKGKFDVSNKEKVEIDMMFLEKKFPFSYSQENNCKLIQLPYVQKELSFCILLPIKRFSLDEVEQKLSPELLNTMLNEARETKAMFLMPKFKLEEQMSMKETLSSLGMTELFIGGKADLSGMDGSHNLYVSDVIHKACIEVNEEGSEAAAASAVMVSLMSMPMEFRVDQPFIFFIRDNRTGAILFMGRVNRPTI